MCIRIIEKEKILTLANGAMLLLSDHGYVLVAVILLLCSGVLYNMDNLYLVFVRLLDYYFIILRHHCLLLCAFSVAPVVVSSTGAVFKVSIHTFTV